MGKGGFQKKKKKETKRFHEVLKLEFAVKEERNTTIECYQPGVLLCEYHFLLVFLNDFPSPVSTLKLFSCQSEPNRKGLQIQLEHHENPLKVTTEVPRNNESS